MSIDVMIDLETTGVEPGCCILSIGATTFDLKENFYVKILHQSCKDIGLVDDPATLSWWSKQDPVARETAFSGETRISDALGKFYDWFNRLGDSKTTFIWGNGADFDIPILAEAYSAARMKKPWKPYNGRCYRTLKNLYKGITPGEFRGTKHDALADAINQASHAYAILKAHFAQVQD